jgi:hypothetical protein
MNTTVTNCFIFHRDTSAAQQNILIRNASQYPIWIGLVQQEHLCSLPWPLSGPCQVSSAVQTISDIVLRWW